MHRRIAIAIEDSENLSEKLAKNLGSCSKFVIYEIDQTGFVLLKETYFNPIVGNPADAIQIPAFLNQFNIDRIILSEIDSNTLNDFNLFDIEVTTIPVTELDHVISRYVVKDFMNIERVVQSR